MSESPGAPEEVKSATIQPWEPPPAPLPARAQKRPKDLPALQRPKYDPSHAALLLPSPASGQEASSFGPRDTEARTTLSARQISTEDWPGAAEHRHVTISDRPRSQESSLAPLAPDHETQGIAGHRRKNTPPGTVSPWVHLTESSEHIQRLKTAHAEQPESILGVRPLRSPLETNPRRGADSDTLWEELHGSSGSSASPSPAKTRPDHTSRSPPPGRSNSPPGRLRSQGSAHPYDKRSGTSSRQPSRPGTQQDSRTGSRKDSLAQTPSGSRPGTKQHSRPSTRQSRATTRPGTASDSAASSAAPSRRVSALRQATETSRQAGSLSSDEMLELLRETNPSAYSAYLRAQTENRMQSAQSILEAHVRKALAQREEEQNALSRRREGLEKIELARQLCEGLSFDAAKKSVTEGRKDLARAMCLQEYRKEVDELEQRILQAQRDNEHEQAQCRYLADLNYNNAFKLLELGDTAGARAYVRQAKAMYDKGRVLAGMRKRVGKLDAALSDAEQLLAKGDELLTEAVERMHLLDTADALEMMTAAKNCFKVVVPKQPKGFLKTLHKSELLADMQQQWERAVRVAERRKNVVQSLARSRLYQARYRALRRHAINLEASCRRSIHHTRYHHLVTVSRFLIGDRVEAQLVFAESHVVAIELQALLRAKVVVVSYAGLRGAACRLSEHLRRLTRRVKYTRRLKAIITVARMFMAVCVRRRWQAAKKISAAARAPMHRTRWMRSNLAAAALQAVARRWMVQYMRDNVGDSVCLLQATCRRLFARKDNGMRRKLEVLLAGRIIQAMAFRSLLRRIHLAPWAPSTRRRLRVRQPPHARLLRLLASLHICRVAWRASCLREVQAKRSSAVFLQAAVRRRPAMLAHIHYVSLRHLLGSMIRWSAMRRLEAQRAAARVIHGACRRAPAQRLHLERRASATELEAVLRSKQERAWWIPARGAVLTIQASVRRAEALWRHRRALLAAILLQCVLRRQSVCRPFGSFGHLLSNVDVLQAHARRCAAQSTYRRLVQNMALLQDHVRRHLGVVWFRTRQTAQRRGATSIRRQKLQTEFRARREQARVLEAHARRSRWRKRYTRLIIGRSVLQAGMRRGLVQSKSWLAMQWLSSHSLCKVLSTYHLRLLAFFCALHRVDGATDASLLAVRQGRQAQVMLVVAQGIMIGEQRIKPSEYHAEEVLTHKIYRGFGIGEDAFFCGKRHTESALTFPDSEVDLIYLKLDWRIVGEILRSSIPEALGISKVLGEQRTESDGKGRARATKAKLEAGRAHMEVELSSLARIHEREKEKRKQHHLGKQNDLTIEDRLMQILFAVERQQLQEGMAMLETDAQFAASAAAEAMCGSTLQLLVHQVCQQALPDADPSLVQSGVDVEVAARRAEDAAREAEEVRRRYDDSSSACFVRISDLEQQRESERNFLSTEMLKNEIDFQRREEMEEQRLAQTAAQRRVDLQLEEEQALRKEDIAEEFAEQQHRRDGLKVLSAMVVAFDLQHIATMLLQGMARRMLRRNRHGARLHSGSFLKAVAHRAFFRRRLCKRRVGAVECQSVLRRVIPRRVYRMSIWASQRLQGACRRRPHRVYHAECLGAMARLHAAARGALGRRAHGAELVSGDKLQAYTRESVARHTWCKHVEAVIRVVCSIKRLLARRPVALKMAKLLPIPLLSSLDWGDVLHLAFSSTICSFKSGEIVIKNKDSGDSMFVMLAGQVGIIIDLPNGQQLTVAHLGEGAAFGEMSLLTGAPRGATVAAEEDSGAIEIRKDALDPILQSKQELAGSLSSLMADRQAKNLWTAAQKKREEEQAKEKEHAEARAQEMKKRLEIEAECAVAIEKMVRFIEIQHEMDAAQHRQHQQAEQEQRRREEEERDAEIMFEVELFVEEQIAMLEDEEEEEMEIQRQQEQEALKALLKQSEAAKAPAKKAVPAKSMPSTAKPPPASKPGGRSAASVSKPKTPAVPGRAQPKPSQSKKGSETPVAPQTKADNKQNEHAADVSVDVSAWNEESTTPGPQTSATTRSQASTAIGTSPGVKPASPSISGNQKALKVAGATGDGDAIRHADAEHGVTVSRIGEEGAHDDEAGVGGGGITIEPGKPGDHGHETEGEAGAEHEQHTVGDDETVEQDHAGEPRDLLQEDAVGHGSVGDGAELGTAVVPFGVEGEQIETPEADAPSSSRGSASVELTQGQLAQGKSHRAGLAPKGPSVQARSHSSHSGEPLAPKTAPSGALPGEKARASTADGSRSSAHGTPSSTSPAPKGVGASASRSSPSPPRTSADAKGGAAVEGRGRAPARGAALRAESAAGTPEAGIGGGVGRTSAGKTAAGVMRQKSGGKFLGDGGHAGAEPQQEEKSSSANGNKEDEGEQLSAAMLTPAQQEALKLMMQKSAPVELSADRQEALKAKQQERKERMRKMLEEKKMRAQQELQQKEEQRALEAQKLEAEKAAEQQRALEKVKEEAEARVREQMEQRRLEEEEEQKRRDQEEEERAFAQLKAREAAKLKANMASFFDLNETAAIQLAAYVRMGEMREVFLVNKVAARALQAAMRRYDDVLRFQATIEARWVLAMFVKRRVPRASFLEMQEAEKSLAGTVRCALARRPHVEQVVGASRLENAIRMQLARDNFVRFWKLLVSSAELLQARVRVRPAQARFCELRASATCLQAPLRRARVRSTYAARRRAGCDLIVYARARTAREEYASKRRAASELKSSCTRVVWRSRLAMQRMAALQLQCCARQRVTFSPPVTLWHFLPLVPEFGGLPRAVRLELGLASDFRQIDSGKAICSKAEGSSGCFLLLRGAASYDIAQSTPEDAGAKLSLAVGSCFELLSFLTGCDHSFSVSAAQRSCVAHIPSHALKGLLAADESLIGAFSTPTVTHLDSFILAAQGLSLNEDPSAHDSMGQTAGVGVSAKPRRNRSGDVEAEGDSGGKPTAKHDLLTSRRDALLRSRMAAFCGLEAYSSTSIQAAARRSVASRFHACRLVAAVRLLAYMRREERAEFIARKLAAVEVTSHCAHRLRFQVFGEWLLAAIEIQRRVRQQQLRAPFVMRWRAISSLQARVRRNDLKIVAKMRALLLLRRNPLFQDVAPRALDALVGASRAVRVRGSRVLVLKDSDSTHLVMGISTVLSLRQEDAAVQRKRVRTQKRWDRVRRAKFMLRLLKGLQQESEADGVDAEDDGPEDCDVSGPTELDQILYKKTDAAKAVASRRPERREQAWAVKEGQYAELARHAAGHLVGASEVLSRRPYAYAVVSTALGVYLKVPRDAVGELLKDDRALGFKWAQQIAKQQTRNVWQKQNRYTADGGSAGASGLASMRSSPMSAARPSPGLSSFSRGRAVGFASQSSESSHDRLAMVADGVESAPPPVTTLTGSLDLHDFDFSETTWDETKNKIQQALQEQFGHEANIEVLPPVPDPVSGDLKVQFRSTVGPASAENLKVQSALRDSSSLAQAVQESMASQGVQLKVEASVHSVKAAPPTAVTGNVSLQGLDVSDWDDTQKKIKKALQLQLGTTSDIEILPPITDPTTKSVRVQFRSFAPSSSVQDAQEALKDPAAFSQALAEKMAAAGVSAHVQARVDSVQPAHPSPMRESLKQKFTKVSGKQMRQALFAARLAAHSKREQRRVRLKELLLGAILKVREGVRAQLEERIRAAFLHRMAEMYGMETLAQYTFEAALLRHFCQERYQAALITISILQAGQRCAWASGAYAASVSAAMVLQRVSRSTKLRARYSSCVSAAEMLQAVARRAVIRRHHAAQLYAATVVLAFTAGKLRFCQHASELQASAVLHGFLRRLLLLCGFYASPGFLPILREAASNLSRHIRQRLARDVFSRRRVAAVELQSAVRPSLLRREFRRQRTASVVLCARVRRELARIQHGIALVAASQLHSVLRRALRQRILASWVLSATTVSVFAKAKLYRSALSEWIRAALQMQAVVRRAPNLARLADLFVAGSRVTAAARQSLFCRQYVAKLAASYHLLAVARRAQTLHTNRYEQFVEGQRKDGHAEVGERVGCEINRQGVANQILQSKIRRSPNRSAHIRHIASAAVCQASVRALLARQEHAQRVRAAIMVDAAVRGAIARRKHRRKIAAAYASASARATPVRRIYIQKLSAARVLEGAMRQSRARRHHIDIKTATSSLEDHMRILPFRQRLATVVAANTTLASSVRQSLRRRWYLDRRWAVQRLQSAPRRLSAMRALAEQKAAIQSLQAVCRRKGGGSGGVREVFNRHMAAIVLQAAVRRALVAGLYKDPLALAARLHALYPNLKFAEEIARDLSAAATQGTARRALMHLAYAMRGAVSLPRTLVLVQQWEQRVGVPWEDRFGEVLAALILQCRLRRGIISGSGQASYIKAAKGAAIPISGVFRRLPCRSRYCEIHGAVPCLGAPFKRQLARSLYKDRLNAASRLLGTLIGRRFRRQHLCRIDAGLSLQATCKASKARRTLSEQVKGTLVLQAAVRRRLQNNTFSDERATGSQLQAALRRVLARTQHIRALEAAVQLQAAVRRAGRSTSWRPWKTAAIGLQARCGMLWWRLRFYYMVRLGLKCSSTFRRRPLNRQHVRLVAAMRLQAKIRSSLFRRLLIRKLELLCQVPLFETLQRKDLLRMADIGRFESFFENEMIVKQGDTGDDAKTFWVVERGTCIVLLDTNAATASRSASTSSKPRHLVVGKVGRAGLLGEMSVLSGAPRAASILAMGPQAMYGTMMAGNKELVSMDAMLKRAASVKRSGSEPVVDALRLPQEAMKLFTDAQSKTMSEMILDLVRKNYAHTILVGQKRFQRVARRVLAIIRLYRALIDLFRQRQKVAQDLARLQHSRLVQNKWTKIFEGRNTLAANIIKSHIKRYMMMLKKRRGDFERPDFLDEWNETLVAGVHQLEDKLARFANVYHTSEKERRRRLHTRRMHSMTDIPIDMFAPWLAPMWPDLPSAEVDASAAMQTLASHPLFAKLAAEGGVQVHVYPPLRSGPHPTSIRGRACAFGAAEEAICVCHPHLHNPIIGGHDDLVAEGLLDPEYGIDPDSANARNSTVDISPPLVSGAEEAKAGQELSTISEESEDVECQSHRGKVIVSIERQIEKLLDTAVALALNKGAEDVYVEDCVQVAIRLSFAVSREVAKGGGREREVLDQLARPLRLVDMGHVAVNSLNYVEMLYHIGCFHTRRGDLLRSHICVDTAIFSRRNSATNQRRRPEQTAPIPGVQISALLSACWGYQKAFMLLLDGHPTAALRSSELAAKTARHVLALVEASPPTDPPPWYLDFVQVKALALHGEAMKAMCLVCLGDFHGARRMCANVLKEYPPSLCQGAGLLDNRPILRIVQLHSVATVCLKEEKRARDGLASLQTDGVPAAGHANVEEAGDATSKAEGDVASAVSIFGDKSMEELLDQHQRWEARVNKALLGLRKCDCGIGRQESHQTRSTAESGWGYSREGVVSTGLHDSDQYLFSGWAHGFGLSLRLREEIRSQNRRPDTR